MYGDTVRSTVLSRGGGGGVVVRVTHVADAL
jgi:hypothetical protein